MKILNTQRALPEPPNPKPEPLAPPPVDTGLREIANALLSQSNNNLEVISALIKSQKLLDSHAVVMSGLIESAKAPPEPPRGKTIRVKVVEFDTYGRPIEYEIKVN